MRPPTPPPTQQGFTLIEVLIAVVIGLVAVGLVVAVLPRAAGSADTQAREVQASVRTTKLTQLLTEQFRDGSFQGFVSGSATALQAVFTTGSPVTVPAHRDIHTLSTLTIPGLDVPTGREVLLVADGGAAKLATVSARSGESFTLTCATGLPSTGDIRAYPARTLTLNLAGDQITRTQDGRVSSLGPAQGTSFSYVYEAQDGTLTRDPAGAPANEVNAGRLVGLIPASVETVFRSDRLALVPLEAGPVRRLLACSETAAVSPNEGRLNVTIEGLPGGVNPDVRLTGPDPAVDGQRPGSTRSYAGIQRGEYAMTAGQVSAGGRTYLASVRGSPTTLYNTWGQVFMLAQYREARGSLTVNITGLPAGAQAGVTVRGPENRDLSLGTGAYPLDLPAGSYTLTTAPQVSAGGVTYTPTRTSAAGTLNPDGAVMVTFAYQPPPTSTLRLSVRKSTGGTFAPTVTVLTTNSANNTVSAFTTPQQTGDYTFPLEPGRWYSVSAETVITQDDGYGIAGIRPVGYDWAQTFTLAAGQTKAVTVVFEDFSNSGPGNPPPRENDPPGENDPPPVTCITNPEMYGCTPPVPPCERPDPPPYCTAGGGGGGGGKPPPAYSQW
jgi:prepilin-type N-terminal cleavage/methylation domain-containing protein